MNAPLVFAALVATCLIAQARQDVLVRSRSSAVPGAARSPAPRTATAPARQAYPSYGSVERLSPAFDALVAPGTPMEKLADGFTWSEGPTWLKRDGALVFSDVPKNRAYRWSERDGVSVFLEPSGYTGSALQFREPGSNGLTTDAAGHLYLCQHGDRRISRLDGKKFTPFAEFFNGRRFSSPNDLVFARDGRLFFTDPPYGHALLDASPLKEIMFNGVYVRRTDGSVGLVTSKLTFPNGIGLSPDEKTLYVAVSDPKGPVIMAFELAPDGSAGRGRVFFDAAPLARPDRPGNPDGLKVDARGNVWATGPGGVLVIAPDGTHLGTLVTGQPTGNCAWGDDGSTLYITSNHDLVRIRTLSKGIGF